MARTWQSFVRPDDGEGLAKCKGNIANGVSVIGRCGYFGFCQTPSALRSLDKWLRRRVVLRRLEAWTNLLR